MELSELAERYSGGTPERCKAIFSTIFIVSNRLQAIFDRHIPRLTLRQFMLLSIARQSAEPLTLTKLGELLGCSRQNVKKLALALQEKGFARLRRSDEDARAADARGDGRGGEVFHRGVCPLRRGARRAVLGLYRGGDSGAVRAYDAALRGPGQT